MKQINIVIASQVGVGKTTIANRIKKVLEADGFRVTVRDKKKKDNEPISDEHVDKVKEKAEIFVTTVQTARNSLTDVRGL